CISDIESWIVTNKRQLNSSKTELFVLTSSDFSKHSNDFQLQIDSNLIAPGDSAKTVSVLLHQHLSTNYNVAGISKVSYVNLRNTRNIKYIRSHDLLTSVVHAFITSMLDYCNSLLLGLPDK
ncbi:hypothetical protein LSH36_1219g00009, partial [Paralvinella palmiformis]